MKGKENRVADALSRKLHHIYEISFSQVELNFVDQLKEAAQKDPEYSYLWQQVKSAQSSAKQREYSINSKNLLLFKNRIYVPNQLSLKQSMLNEFHRSPCATHPGYQKPLTAIKKAYHWSSIWKDIAENLAKCLEC